MDIDTLVDMNRRRSNGPVPTVSGPSLNVRLPLKALSALFIAVLAVGLMGSLPAQGQTTTYARGGDIVAVEGGTPALAASSDASTQRLGAAERVPSVEEVPALGHTISVRLSGASLEQALRRIAAKAGLKLAYLQESVAAGGTVTLEAESVSVREALLVSLRGTDLQLTKASERQLVLTGRPALRKTEGRGLSVLKHVQAAGPAAPRPPRRKQGTISGTITSDATGNPLPGVNVLVEGTDLGAATGADGTYAITGVEPGTYTVRASFIGYGDETEQGVEVTDGETTTVDFTMQQEAAGLDEVVVVGYGEQQQRDLTGAVSSLSSEDIEEVPVANVVEALQGKLPGVTITRSGWSPTSGSSIRVRGARSITAGNDPLVVVDGAPWEGAVGDLSPSNIASIEVLKGPSATAIYGSRGANGVVVISTKEGVPGETEVSYSSYVGAQRPYRTLDLMNSQEWQAMVDQGYQNAGAGDTPRDQRFTAAELQGIEQGRETDWQDLVFQTGIQQDHNLQLRGGSGQTRFTISPSFYDQEGIITGERARKYTLHGRVSHQFGDDFNASLSVLASRTQNDYMPGGLLNSAMQIPPVVGPYDEDGSLVLLPHGENVAPNPLADIENRVQERTRDRARLSLSAAYDFLPSLTYELQFTPEVIYSTFGDYAGSLTSANVGAAPTASQNEDRNFRYTLNNILRFQKTFADRHDVGLTFVNTLEEDQGNSLSADVRGLPFNSLYYSLGSAEEIIGTGSDLTEWRLLSFAGRVNYHFNDKYLLTMTGRADGSSRLAPGNKWAFFPSAAVGWRISEEPFMDPVDNTLSNLKLRVEYGASGNTAIDPYQVQGGLGRVPYVFGEAPAFGYRVSSLSNPDLSWERTTQFNVGLDLGLWGDRLTATANYYRQNTTNLLLNRQLPTSTGFSSILTNVGATRNVGFELSLSSLNISTDDFQWRTELNFSTNRNEIVELYGDGGDYVANQWFIGEPISVYYNHEFGGIWQEEEAQEAAEYGREPGEIRVVDQNSDGTINDEDRVILGSEFPSWTGGLTNTLNYQNVDMTFVLNTVQGRMIYNDWRSFFYPANTRFNAVDVNYWTPSTPSNEWPRPDQSFGTDTPYNQLLNYVDGSYLRIRRITLGYTLPASFTQRLGGESWRLYATVQNPYVFASDDLVGFDPENARSPGQAPSYRTYLFGVQLSF